MAQALNGSFFLFFIVIVSLALQMAAGREIPKDPKLHPDFFGHYDGTVLIPGIGRVMVPKKGQIPFHYNPITGAPGGVGVSIPNIGGSTGRRYIPGGDDTFLPNPGVEVPIPAGGDVPIPSSP